MKNKSDNSEVSAITVKELAAIGIPGFPSTERACLDLVKREGWEWKEIKGKGRGGVRREYIPPARIAFIIASIKEADSQFFGSGEMKKSRIARELEPPAHASAPEGFILVPRYDVTGSMGNGHMIHSEQIVDHLAFRSEWVRTELGTSSNNLVLISAVGDSMEPALHAHDLLLIDRSVLSVKQDAIYAFAVEGELRVKRIQRLFDGSLIIKSDNPSYATETLTVQQAEAINLVGRVVWSGRRM